MPANLGDCHLSNTHQLSVSLLFAEIVEYVCLGLELPRTQLELSRLLHRYAVLQHLDSLLEVFPVVLIVISLVFALSLFTKQLDFFDGAVSAKILLAQVEHNLIEFILPVKGSGVALVLVNPWVEHC